MRVLSPRRFLSWLVGLGVAVCLAQSLAAQDVAITNVRIIVDDGAVVPSATIIVRGGKIVSASAGAADIQNLKIIDANGMSAMPGFIDAHKHINTGPNEKELMLSLLEAGYTTVLWGRGPCDGNLTLRDHIESGMINGPRIIPSERVNLSGTPDEARAAVRAMAAKGIKHTGEIALTPEPGRPHRKSRSSRQSSTRRPRLVSRSMSMR